MATVTNPFIVTDKIHPEYFCDRVQETAQIITSLTNGNNIVMISPRRMGKTGLINYCYEKAELRNNYYTFIIDILHTSSLKEFTYLLAKEIFNKLLDRGRKTIGFFVETMKSINKKFGVDPLTDLPTFKLKLLDIKRPERTLDELFQVLTLANKPCVLAIEEFQQINKYLEKDIEELLRSYVYKVNNCRFIFAGSEHYVLQKMFLSPESPLYNIADMLELNPIGPENYVPFITELFEEHFRKIEMNNVIKVYQLFEGHTYYMQKTFNEAFNDTPRKSECTLEIIQKAISRLITCNETQYREILSNLPVRQKELLYAIARDKYAEHLISMKFLKRHKLNSYISIQTSTNKLLLARIITEKDLVYSVTDRFFAMWINGTYGKTFSL